MLDNVTATNGAQKMVRLPSRIALIMLVLVAVGLSSMGYLLWHGSIWLYGSWQQWQPSNPVAVASPFAKLKGLFQKNKSVSPIAAPEQIRIVGEEQQVIDVVKKASPAVVSIVASAEVPRLERCYQRAPGLYDLPPEFQDFFQMDIPALCQRGTERRRVGAGSGFLVSSDGYVITNKHVVADEKAEYTVVLNDPKNLGQKVKASVLARDPNNDIAILKIDRKDLPFLAFGDSTKLQVGQTAIAIGYALGEFDNTVSKGVVSGLARSVSAFGNGRQEELRGLIQTDAAINPGNSGGPLLDIAGRVIGVNVAMAQAQSIGFAIPSQIAQRSFEQVKQTGKISAAERAFLGVRYAPVTPELKAKNNLTIDYGMLITRGPSAEGLAVMPGSPADKAGLRENDIILEVNGQQLNERYLLVDALEAFKPGDEVELTVLTRGEVKKVKVKLEQRK